VATLPLLPMDRQNCLELGMIIFIKRGELEIKYFMMINRERQTRLFLLQFCEELFKWKSSIYEECHRRLISQNIGYNNKIKLLLTQVSIFPIKLHTSISRV
jgi:hypothetical protein